VKEAVYRVDPKTAQIEKSTMRQGSLMGSAFPPDYKKVYVADTGSVAM
jgi:gluconolactonase